MRHLILVVALLSSSAWAQPLAGPLPPLPDAVRYDGHAVVRATIRSQRDLMTMLSLSPDMWSHRVEADGTADFRVPPEAMAALRASGIPFRVSIADVQRDIDAERARLAGNVAGAPDGPWFQEYKTYAQVNDYLLTLRDLRPDLAEVFTIGTSLQGRSIRAIRIRTGPGGGPCKPMILLTGCQHAREWIAVMVTTYLADQLIRQHGTNPAVTAVVNAADIVIVPIVNPDGYEWTWSNNRLWRKNRRPNAGGSFGVDLNRNWGFQWGVTLPHQNAGNNNPSSDVYWGTAAFSEPETQAIRDFTLGKPQVRWHNDIHSYAQLLLHPWGYSPGPSPDEATFVALGAEFRTLIQAVHGRVYTPGRMYSALYPVSGGVTDWFYGDRGVHAFLHELRGDGGGFVLPPEHILPNAEEVFPAILRAAEWTVDRYPFRADFNHDCVYNLGDFGAFQTRFALGDPLADFNGDGVLNIADFGAFQTAFALGR